MKSRLWRVLMVVAAFSFSQVGFAAAKTLIEMDGGKPKAGLAKSWKKVKDGVYSFELDPGGEVKAGVKVTGAMVKDSLEGKLGSDLGVKVTDKGGSVDVSYTSDEAKFLEGVSKTKIRDNKDTSLALESSVSEGGIRAKNTERGPTDGEVKAIVIKVEKGFIQAKVHQSKAKNVKEGAKVKVKGALKDLKQGEYFFFKPEKEEGGAWVPKAGSLE